MSEVLGVLVPSVVTIASIFRLLAWDERRMRPEERHRAWPVTTRAIAAVCFTALCLPIHFARTRRSLQGALVGLAWGAAVVALDCVVAEGVGAFAHACVARR